MSTYWCAIDIDKKLFIQSPDGVSLKFPYFIAIGNPFPAMVMMKNMNGEFNFILTNEHNDLLYDGNFYDITDEVYREYLEILR